VNVGVLVGSADPTHASGKSAERHVNLLVTSDELCGDSAGAHFERRTPARIRVSHHVAELADLDTAAMTDQRAALGQRCRRLEVVRRDDGVATHGL
jgi:hypothetical protein